MSKYAPHKPSTSNPKATSTTLCQKCLKRGHFTYQCKNERPYVSRPSRTQQLEKPSLLAKRRSEGVPSIEVPEEFKNKSGMANKILESKEQERAGEKGKVDKKRKRSSSSSDSGSSSDSDSNSSGSSSSNSDSGSSRSASSRSRSPARRSRRRSTSRSKSYSSDEDSDRR